MNRGGEGAEEAGCQWSIGDGAEAPGAKGGVGRKWMRETHRYTERKTNCKHTNQKEKTVKRLLQATTQHLELLQYDFLTNILSLIFQKAPEFGFKSSSFRCSL